MIKYPTCFVRCIRDQKEEDFIKENSNYILSVIKKHNELNKIIFLGAKEKIIDFPLRYFPLNLNYDYNLLIGRNLLFDGNYDIIKYLCLGMDAEKIERNLFFSKQKFLKRESAIESRYTLAIKLLQCKTENLKKLPKEIAIYGAGNIGKNFYEKCNKICKVECLIDKRPRESNYKNVKIIHYNNINLLKTNNFVITAVYDIEMISSIIKNYKPDANIIPLDMII